MKKSQFSTRALSAPLEIYLVCSKSVKTVDHDGGMINDQSWLFFIDFFMPKLDLNISFSVEMSVHV